MRNHPPLDRTCLLWAFTFSDHGYWVKGMGKILNQEDNHRPTWSEPWVRGDEGAKLYAYPENEEAARRNQDEARARGKQGWLGNGPATECADVPDDAYRDGRRTGTAIQALRDLKERKQPFFRCRVWCATGSFRALAAC